MLTAPSVPREDASESYGDSEASVKLISYHEGEMLHLESMQATSQERSTNAGSHHGSAGITIQFRNAAGELDLAVDAFGLGISI